MSFRELSLKGFYSAGDDRLNGFFVPLLQEATRYDRIAGYFRSSALAAAARGLARFIASDGQMRLIAGADLSRRDHEALMEGEPLSDVIARALKEDPVGSADLIVSRRLDVLAWLVREGRLEIKIGIPLDADGCPLKRSQTDAYFHSKYGIFTDVGGNKVAFIGSDNETEEGILNHHESFTVAKSWLEEVWTEQGRPVAETFENHWNGTPDAGWAVLDLPEAVRLDLVSLSGSRPPQVDPEEKVVVAWSDIRRRFLVAAPRLNGGTGVGMTTSGIVPWPHQSAIASKIVDTFPRSYLLADEVGLGKTIEIGLVLRELFAADKARSALLLVPAGVMRQWQEELREKFALDVPRFEGGTFLDTKDREVAWKGPLWSAFPIVLASSHLARRRDRRSELISAGPWDVVLVDEAHHARRSGSKSTATPNTLLALLRAMKDQGSWRALYLASATPMQMYPHEAWDLLELLGLPGRWSNSAEDFVRYYQELRKPFPERDWSFLFEMSRDFYKDQYSARDRVLESKLKADLGMAGSRFIRDFAEVGLSKGGARELESSGVSWMDEWLRTHTPMRDRVFRTTRDVLRAYLDRGVLDARTVIPRRVVRDEFVPMSSAEFHLYKRIETYISRFYDAVMKGSNAQKPLGFIMTVYRRRLTSSFLAIERSLQRRLESLTSAGSVGDMLDLDDIIGLETSAHVDFDRLDGAIGEESEEVEELRSFLEELRERPPDESKMEYLHRELDEAFSSGHGTALIFTQYADTMDYLGAQLLPVYGDRLVLYSGGGGRRFDLELGEWTSLSKEQVKELFREGKEVKLLIGTDSLSEGLNLQTCSKLINYDVPWNFMRVEQRIGRVDRIGGQPRVDITNYFYVDTVEEQIYRGIGEDFDWFEDVVGPAQPVLSQVEKAIESVAMETPSPARDEGLRNRVVSIRQQIQEARAQAISLNDFQSVPGTVSTREPAITLSGIEHILTSDLEIGPLFEQHPRIEGAYLLALTSGRRVVTFRPDVVADHSPAVSLVTYLSPELTELTDIFDLPEHPGSTFEYDGTAVNTYDELESRLAQVTT